jgi:periplasmic copper chaperone A
MIGEVRVLFLAALIALNPVRIAPLGVDHSPAPLPRRWQAGQLNWKSAEGVPVSLSIQNDGDEDDRLLRVSTPIAKYVRIDRTQLVGGRPQTVPVQGGLVIPKGARITLEPGTSHLTLLGLRADLVQGETFPLMLHFDRAGAVPVVARVRQKVDAAGTSLLPSVSVGNLTIAMASAPPAPAATPLA